MVVDTAQAVAIGLGLLLAIRVLNSGGHGQAFTADNVRRMTSIGRLALAFLAVSVVEVATTLWAQERLGTGSWFSQVSFVSGIAALAVFALAQVWSRGDVPRTEPNQRVAYMLRPWLTQHCWSAPHESEPTCPLATWPLHQVSRHRR